MKKRVLSLALALLMTLSLIPAALAAGDDKPQRGVLTYTEHIAPQYEGAGQFSEDLAAVKKNGKWGYIDKDNKVVIPFQYELAYEFNEGYAVVAKSSRQETFGEGTEWEETDTVYELGFIDKAGKYTPFMAAARNDYGELTGGTEKLEVYEYRLDTQGYIFHNGFAVIDYGLYRFNGSQVVIQNSQGWEYGPIGPVNEGLVPVTSLDGIGWNAFGWADTSGKLVKLFMDDPIPGYDITYVQSFNQGVATVWAYDEALGDDVVGFMNRSFQWVIQPAYTNFIVHNATRQHQVFGDTGLAMVKNANGKWGGIDKTGKTVLSFQYDGLYPYYQGLATFKANGKWGFMDDKGQTVIPAQYVIASSFSDDGYAVAYDGNKAFLIDKTGKEIPGADQLNPSSYFVWEEGHEVPRVYTPDEYVVIEKNDMCGFGHIEYLQPLPEREEMHDWAYDEVVAAIENDLVPSYLQNLYLNDIKRGEFCDVVIQAMEAVLGKEIAQIVKDKTGEDITNYQHTYPFEDTSDINTLAANKLGIIQGRGNGRFDPYDKITRQEAATMLMRAAKALDMDTDGASDAGFADGGQVASWAVEAVNFICSQKIMTGTGGNNFSPTGSYSREQSFMTIYRLFLNVMQK